MGIDLRAFAIRILPYTLFLAVLSLLFFSFSRLNRGGEIHWHSLVLDEYGDRDEFIELLSSEVADHVYTWDLPVLVNDYTRVTPIKLKELESRFLPEDRRFDPFLKELITLYRADGRERIHFTTSLTPFSLWIRLKRLPGNFHWEQRDSYRLFIVPLVYFLWSGFLIFLPRKGRIYAGVLYLLWFPFILLAPPHWSLYSFVLMALGLLSLEQQCEEKLTEYIVPILLLGLSAYLAFTKGMTPVLYTGILSVFFIKWSRRRAVSNKTRFHVKRGGRGKREHPLFQPTYFKSSGRKGVAENSVITKVFLLMGGCLLFLPVNGEGDESIPFGSYASFLHHRDYQENILYYRGGYDGEKEIPSDYTWDEESGEIRVQPSKITLEHISPTSPRIGDQWVNTAYGPLVYRSLMLPIGGDHVRFDKYIIFTIMILLFVSQVYFLLKNTEGLIHSYIIPIRRGRKVA